MSIRELDEKIKNHVSSDDLQGAFFEFNIFFDYDKGERAVNFIEENNDLILLMAQNEELRRLNLRGIVDQPTIDYKYNKLRHSILTILDKVKKKYSTLNPTKDNSINNANKRIVELVIDRDLVNYDKEEKDKLFQAIQNLLDLSGGSIKITKINSGSIKMKIEIPANLTDTLITEIRNGKLRLNGVIDAWIVYDDFDEYPLLIQRKEESNKRDVNTEVQTIINLVQRGRLGEAIELLQRLVGEDFPFELMGKEQILNMLRKKININEFKDDI